MWEFSNKGRSLRKHFLLFMSTSSFIYLAFLHFCSFKRPGFSDSHLPCFRSKHLCSASIFIHLDFTTAPWDKCYCFPRFWLFSCPVMSNSSWPHGVQHARLPCPWPSPKICPSSCPLNWWCHPTSSSHLPTLEIRKLRHREVKWLSQGHKAQSWPQLVRL